MVNKFFSRTREAWTNALAGGVKAKPHSTPEGRKAAAKRRVLRRILKPQTSPLLPVEPKLPKALKDKFKKITK